MISHSSREKHESPKAPKVTLENTKSSRVPEDAPGVDTSFEQQ